MGRKHTHCNCCIIIMTVECLYATSHYYKKWSTTTIESELDSMLSWKAGERTGAPLVLRDQCEWHGMTRVTGPDCAVMCNLINKYTHTHTHTRASVASNPSPILQFCIRAGENTLGTNLYCYTVRWHYYRILLLTYLVFN